jgi:hypothetical protein
MAQTAWNKICSIKLMDELAGEDKSSTDELN